jgi:hypothetical protein
MLKPAPIEPSPAQPAAAHLYVIARTNNPITAARCVSYLVARYRSLSSMELYGTKPGWFMDGNCACIAIEADHEIASDHGILMRANETAETYVAGAEGREKL